MYTLPIKALYKAVTTTKKYILVEDISTNYLCYKYTATDNENLVDKALDNHEISVISCEYYRDNLQALQNAYNDMMEAFSKNCYYYELQEFLKKYELSIFQAEKINRLINQGA